MTIAVDFQFEREPDRDWIRELRHRWPITTEHAWPYVLWEPGDPWIPGERWVIYEMVPEWLFLEQFQDPDVVLEELCGPHPRSDGHFCSDREWRHTSARWPKQFQCLCPRHLSLDPATKKSLWTKMDAWTDGPCSLITVTQWKLWRQCPDFVGMPLWIIQGTKGGHPFEYDKFQQRMLRIAELPHEAPALGSLPYAPFDGRVVDALERHNRLKQLGMTLAEYRRTMRYYYEQHKASIEQEMRRQWVQHLATQMEDVNDLFVSAARKGELDDAAPRTDIDYERLDDLSTQSFIETGRILAPQEISTALMVSFARARSA